jgi:hypothetical protein
LSAPFCSRGFRWNFLPALARFFAGRSRPVQYIFISEERTRQGYDWQKKGLCFRQYQKKT